MPGKNRLKEDGDFEPGKTRLDNRNLQGSVVTKDIEPESVAVGVPAKRIMSIDDYYRKRKEVYIQEAKEYVRSIWRNLNRMPKPEDFREFFPLFLNEDEYSKYKCRIPVSFQSRMTEEAFFSSNKPKYKSFEDFINDALSGEVKLQ